MVPVETLRKGDLIELPNRRQVWVDSVDLHEPDEWTPHPVYIVNWWRVAEHGEPGAPRDGKPEDDARDGRYLATLKPLREGELVDLVERKRLTRVA